MRLPYELRDRAIEDYTEQYLFYYNENNPAILTDSDIFAYGGLPASKSRNYVGYCTACKSWVRVPTSHGQSPVHKYSTHCPECGRTVTQYNGNYGKKGIRDIFTVQAFEVAEYNKVYLHEAIIRICDYTDIENPQVETIDLRCTEITPGKSTSWNFDGKMLKTASSCSEYILTGQKYMCGIRPISGKCYLMDEDELENSFLKYQYRLAPFSSDTTERLDYYIRVAEEPMLELMYKLGHENFVEGRAYRQCTSRYANWRAKSPKEFIKNCKSEIRRKVIELIRLLPPENQLKVWDIDDFVKLFRRAPELKPEQLTNNAKIKISAVFTLSDISASKVINYIDRHKDDDRNALSRFYIDYLYMCYKSGANLANTQIAFPKNITEAHDIMCTRLSIATDTNKDKLIAARAEKLNAEGYHYSWRGLEIVIPRETYDIIAEGNAQDNCVGGYCDRHAQNKTTILFVRKTDAPAQSFFTLEVKPAELKKGFDDFVVQCYGYKNRVNAKENPIFEQGYSAYVNEFLRRYQRHLQWCAAHKKEAKKYHSRKEIETNGKRKHITAA